MKTPQQAHDAWVQSAGRAATAWSAGIDGYTGDWAAATTRQKQAWVQGLLDAQANNRWENGVNRAGTNKWRTNAKAKAGNFSGGFTAGANAQLAAIGKIMQAEANINASLPPRGTFEQNKARMNAVVDQLHALRGQLGAS